MTDVLVIITNFLEVTLVLALTNIKKSNIKKDLGNLNFHYIYNNDIINDNDNQILIDVYPRGWPRKQSFLKLITA